LIDILLLNNLFVDIIINSCFLMLRNICSAIMVIFLINLAQSVPPWSYVPSRWFAACKYILTEINSSYPHQDRVHTFHQL